MPTISTFFGITVRMFYTEHPPPHFHVRYQRHRALIAIETGAMLHGSLPPGALRILRAWAARHRGELTDNWNRGRARLPFQRIPGADVE
jgi:uncharacterized protein DUF4160